MSQYQEKIEEKRARFAELAEKARAEAAAASAGANAIANAIPLGQPILVGHHSERRHRRDIERINRGFEKARELSERAAYYEQRATGYGSHGISADDPEAVERLREKKAKLEADREKMKAVNKAFRKGAWSAVAAAGLVRTESIASLEAAMKTCPWERAPFPKYALTNIGARIRETERRIEELSKRAAEPEKAPVECNGFRIEEDTSDNRIRLIFPGKPCEKTRELLRSHGFRFSPRAMAWQRQLNDRGRYAAQAVAKALAPA